VAPKPRGAHPGCLIEFLFLLPYYFSLALAAGVFYFAWRRRRSPSAAAYAWYAFGQALWMLSLILELVSPDGEIKLFWDMVQWISGLIVLLAFPVFALRYTEYKLVNERLAFALSCVIPGLFLALLLTDSQHHLVFAHPRLVPLFPFAELQYDLTGPVRNFVLYYYAIILLGLGLLVSRFIRPHMLYRGQVATIIVGILLPLVGTILSIAGIRITPLRDSTAVAGAIGNLIVAWGLFRFRIFELVPIGRERVFESMADPVVILDNRNVVLDVNRAMLEMLGRRDSSAVIGMPVKDVFEDFPIPIKLYGHVSHARVETSFEIRGRTVHYELTVYPLYDRQKRISGRVYVSHDITAMKELEHSLRTLNQELEQRVQARTEELANAYDTTLEGWARTLELRDKEIEGHSRRVSETTIHLAQALRVRESDLVHIRRGALLHDIGKMVIPDEILHKPDNLTVEERAIMERHPETAFELLRSIPYLEKALDIPYCHHERWDGTGYPRGLAGAEIPLAARIFAVADVWDALGYDRTYNRAWTHERRVQYIKDNSGTHFDPRVVEVFLILYGNGAI
jgi:PAS domain S-box-containing protein/putative nucleotidyltransferase with HDIG domain